MVEYNRTPSSNHADPLRICVAGVGGAGSNVLDRIALDRTVDGTLISFQTDVRVLNRSSAPHKVQMGTELMRGIGSGGDPDLGREAGIFSRDEIRAAVEGHDMVFICTGLGGGTGSGATPVIAEIAKSCGAVVVVFATVPFSFEGRRRQLQCKDALERLEKCTDALILFDNNRMGELVLPKDGIQKAFAQGDQLIGHSIRAVTAMVSAPGLVKLGLDDLVAALRVSEGRCVFGFGEAKGQARGAEALKRALKSPLINQGDLLQNAKNLLVHIVGGESLTLAEVEVVMKQLGRHVPDETQILFGIGIDPKFGDTMTISLVSALSAQELATARRPVEEAAPVVAPQPKASRQPAAVAKPVAAVAPPAAAEASIDDLFQASVAALATPPVEIPPVRAVEPVAVVPPPLPEMVPVHRSEPAMTVTAPPVVEMEPEPESEPDAQAEPEMVYDAHLEEVENEVAEEIEQPVAPAPRRESTRVRLTSVIGAEKAVARAVTNVDQMPPIDEVHLEPEQPPAVLAPMAETARIHLTRTSTNVRPAAASSEPAIVSRAPEPAALSFDQPAPKRTATPVEQQSLRLGGEDRGRFKDTEPSFAAQSNEDLDTPTWMRLRRRVTK
jgi:cell division protein FtsZ